MENSTKALLIAGAVLIAILILSTAVYLHSLFSNQSEQYKETISAVELQKFNSKFDVYVGRDNITAQEIVSVVNLAKKYDGLVKIYLNTNEIIFTEASTPEDFIKNNQNITFRCILNTSASNPNPKYDGNGKITTLRFMED